MATAPFLHHLIESDGRLRSAARLTILAVGKCLPVPKVSRRDVLAWLLLAAVAPLAARGQGALAAPGLPLPPVPNPIAIGREVLSSGSVSRSRLAGLIAKEPRRLRRQICSDFAADRTCLVDGWLLAETEAYLCAAVALGHAR